MLTYLLYKTGQILALALPAKIAYRVAEFFGDLKRIFSLRDRAQVYENLCAIFGPDDPRIPGYVKEVYRNFAKYLVDFFRFSKIDGKFIERSVKLENIHYFDEALKLHRGLIVVTAHLGNWELGGAVASLSGYPMAAVALTHRDKRVNNFFQSQRKISGLEVITTERSFRRCYDALKENKILALVGDRDFSQRGIRTNFLGKSLLIPKGPASLSLACGAPIIAGFLLREKGDKFKLVFEKPIKCALTGERGKDLLNLTNAYLEILERYIRNYPGQWYLFRRFWEPPVW